MSFLCCGIPGLSKAKLLKRVNDKENPRPLLILDVRRPVEYESGHIEGAVNVPITTMRARMPEIMAKIEELQAKAKAEPEVVCICLSAHRSVPAVRLLLEHEVDAKQLEYGMMSWNLGSYPTTKEPRELEQVRFGERVAVL